MINLIVHCVYISVSVFEGVQLFLSLHHALDMHPSLIALLHKHFPRPRMMRSLLNASFCDAGISYPDEDNTGDTRYPPDILDYHEWRRIMRRMGSSDDPIGKNNTVRRGWYILATLEARCQLDRHCMRRGCRKLREKRCKACRTMEYCGWECQEK